MARIKPKERSAEEKLGIVLELLKGTPAYEPCRKHKFIERQGCWHTLSAVGRPQGMGRVERFNRSSKEQRLRLADVEDRPELQAELDGYRKFYNHNRPHHALNGMTPYEFLCAARH
jgi:transposase InsO family protein